MLKKDFVAEKITKLPRYGIQQMFTKAKEMEKSGRDIVHLEFGEPDFNTPKFIIDAAYSAMMKGNTKYVPSMGMIELRESIAQTFQSDFSIEIDSKSEIIILPGAKHALYCALIATINPGDDVIVIDPYFQPYEFAINLAGGRLVSLPLREELNFSLDPNELEKHVTSKTKMILLNFPHNPTGSLLTKDCMASVAEIAKRHDVLVVTDDVYEKFIYDGGKYSPLLGFPDMRERTILVNSFSKTYAMTGWRLGYAIARKEIIEAMRKVQETTTTCVPPFCQMAGVEALKSGSQFVQDMIREFDLRRKFLVKGLNKIRGLSCKMPEGAFFAFPKVDGLGTDSKLSEYLLTEAGVVTVPGSSFGKGGEGHIRISYANSMENIKKAIERMEEAIDKIK